jgi:hypothetical protein
VVAFSRGSIAGKTQMPDRHAKPSFMDKYEFHAWATTDVRPEAVERDMGIRSGSWSPRRGFRNWGFSTAEDLRAFLAAHQDRAAEGWLE